MRIGALVSGEGSLPGQGRDQLGEDSKLARKQAAEFLEGEGAAGGAAIKDVLTKRQTMLKQLDKGFMVEEALFLKSIGEEGDARLKLEILACLPDADAQFDVKTAMTKLSRLGDKKLLTCVGKVAQNIFNSVRGFVLAIQSKRPPRVQGACETDLMVNLKQRLSYFAFALIGGGADQTPVCMSGRAPTKHFYDGISAKAKNNVELAFGDVTDLQVFSWLLNDD